jgi:hypothetical protein
LCPPIERANSASPSSAGLSRSQYCDSCVEIPILVRMCLQLRSVVPRSIQLEKKPSRYSPMAASLLRVAGHSVCRLRKEAHSDFQELDSGKPNVGEDIIEASTVLICGCSFGGVTACKIAMLCCLYCSRDTFVLRPQSQNHLSPRNKTHLCVSWGMLRIRPTKCRLELQSRRRITEDLRSHYKKQCEKPPSGLYPRHDRTCSAH